MQRGKKSIVLGTTVDQSLVLMAGFPEYLVSRGWDVHIVSSGGPRLTDLSLSRGVTVHAVTMARDPAVASDIRSLLLWIGLFRKIRPDVAFVGTPKAGLLSGIAGRITRVPSRVYLLRGLRLETSTGLRRAVYATFERLAMACASDVIAVSSSLRARSLDLRLAQPSKISVVGRGSSNGIDTANYDSSRFSSSDKQNLREELGIVEDVPVVGFVGRLTRDKGVFVFAEALREMVERDVVLQVLVVGEVDHESGSTALSALRALDIPVAVAGYVKNPAAHYALMNVLCLPSYREGFVNVVAEASSSGVAVAVSDATGVVDTVVHEVTGLISPVGDALKLADNLCALISDSAKRDTMGAAGRAWVEANFARHDVQQLHGDALDRLVQASSARRTNETRRS